VAGDVTCVTSHPTRVRISVPQCCYSAFSSPGVAAGAARAVIRKHAASGTLPSSFCAMPACLCAHISVPLALAILCL